MEKQSNKRAPRAKINTPYPINGNARMRHTADFLGISDSTLHRWVKEKRIPLPFELDAGFLVFDAAEIREWVENKKSLRQSI
ncbi:helix-turn-helix domain-containing protein [Providencia rettgeri]|uniref:helix-turn-helix transcriptional regulator n=1 Tax=Providencia TaxID=586 RepID=UPI001B397390|nr:MULTISPECIES: helix-turn-helix domain-containing protein [Providencia]EHZ7766273.1 helix-turn-helix domain-containing protein [Providencia rettgeri]EIJ7169415.1 helix-turn-helix domain-containing protein [Providencia rettgeri]ELR5065613.1 helix-turn-helix domain-containing protein [Providencia rettgeri]ELR5092938.1 helix-turn-helix domain-containing protein [Providencia rettgeri]ELR5105418.1 helix-turn-helix domain-containing protein [Providencia rettgeri]